MMALFFFKKYLFSNRAGSLIRLISWISLLGVAVGVLSLVVVVSVMAGFHEVIRTRLLGLEPHVVVTFKPSTTAAAFTQATEAIRGLSQHWQAVDVVSVDSQDLIVRTLDGVFAGGLARGYPSAELKSFLQRTDDFNREAMHREAAAKSRVGASDSYADVTISQFSPQVADLKEREVALGVDLARSLGVLEGDQVLLIPPEGLLAAKGELPIYERVTVVARVSTRVADMDSKLILYDSKKTMLRLAHSPSREKSVELRLKDPSLAEEAKVELQRVFASARVDSWRDRNEALFFALKMEKLVMTIFLGLSGLITSFSIVSVLSLLVSQKRKEIGLLMTMGMTAHQVQRVFVGIGFFLSTAGIFLGLAVGLMLCGVIDRFPLPLLPDIYYDSTIPVLVTGELVMIVAGLALVVALMSAFLPTRGLSHLRPAETFRLRL